MRFGLRAQIGIVLLGLNVLTVILVGIAAVNLLERSLTAHVLAGDRHMTRFVARTVASGQFVSMELCPQLLAMGMLSAIEVYDADNTRQLACGSEEWFAGVLDESQGELVRSGEDDASFVARVQVPLEDGWLVAVYSHDGLSARVENAQLLTVSYIVLDAVLLLIVGYVLLTRFIVTPIRRIGIAMERVAAGDYASHLTLQRRNELGDLARNFNHMVAKLGDSQHALERKVTALEAAKTELEEAQEVMIRGEKLASVGRLAAGIAHEVGNPLSAMLGFIEILKEDPKLELAERVDLLARLERELLRIHETIRGLLDYSRSSEDDDGPCDLATVVADAQSLVLAQPRYREIELEVDLSSPSLQVKLNADRLLQVLVNLLMNAADAIDGAGIVRIGVRTDGDLVGIVVSDSGTGISPNLVDSLFEPFFTTKPPGSGTGLGLAMCERIIRGSGGRIEVDPRPGEGAQFTIWVPSGS